MNETTSLSGNDVVDRLLELESAKKDALLAFDPDVYQASADGQARLVADHPLDPSTVSRDRVLELSRRMRLNSALLLNLISISPHFALASENAGAGPGYDAEGHTDSALPGRFRVRG